MHNKGGDRLHNGNFEIFETNKLGNLDKRFLELLVRFYSRPPLMITELR
jgi:hypothetical protein